MDVDSLSAYPSLHIQALGGVWTGFVTLLPPAAPVESGSGAGALGARGSSRGLADTLGVSSENRWRFVVCSASSFTEPSWN